MAKFTYKEIKAIIECTPAELKGKNPHDFHGVQVGYFKKAATNWTYQVWAVVLDGRPVLCATVYLEIK